MMNTTLSVIFVSIVFGIQDFESKSSLYPSLKFFQSQQLLFKKKSILNPLMYQNTKYLKNYKCKFKSVSSVTNIVLKKCWQLK